MTVESGGIGCCPFCAHGGARDSKPCERFREDWLCWEYVPALLKKYGMELDPDWAQRHGVDGNTNQSLPVWNGFMPLDRQQEGEKESCGLG